MLVFIHINKTGGSTVRYILRSSFGMRHCEVEPWQARWKGPPFSNEDLCRLRKVYPRLESIAGHRLTGYVDLQENGTRFDYFTLMRDPIKTCASRFQYNVQHRKKTGLVFEEWIQLDWPRDPQTKMIAGAADANEAIRIIQEKNIFVGLTERFDESLLLLKALSAPNLNISYRRMNAASTNVLAKNLLSDARTMQLLVEANQADLQLYEYIKRERYPALQREYGPALEADVVNYQHTRRHHFNEWNINLSRLKQYMLYKPLLDIYRRGIKVI